MINMDLNTEDFKTDFKSNLIERLKNESLRITFTKTNGEQRIICCTLQKDKLPAAVGEKKASRAISPEVCPVFDLELNEWRSFRWDSINVIEIIVWHTIYEGDTIASLHAVYGKQILGEHIKTSHPGIWMQDASLSLRDVTGIATFSESERIAFDQLLTQIGKKFRNVPAATLNAIHKNPDLLELVHRHHNSLIRNKVAVNNIREYVHSLFVFAETKFKKDIEEKKLARSKDAIAQRRQQVMNFFTAHPEKDLLGLFELNSLLKEAKEIIIKKLNNVSALGTFLRTRNGFRTTVPEGFVAIRAAGRTAVKLVDRLEFSTANFSPEIIKGFER